MRYLELRERLALHEPLDLVVEAAMGAAHLLRRGARNPRSGRAHARGGGGGEEGAGQKVWTVARDGGYIIAVFRGREERCGRTSGVLAVVPAGMRWNAELVPVTFHVSMY
jgi:hypothetical protein